MLDKNIKYLRTVSGLSQGAFGELFDASRSMIDSYERNNAKPSPELLTAISNHFKISIDLLLKKELSRKHIMAYTALSESDDEGLQSKDQIIADLVKQIKSQQATIMNQQSIIDRFLSDGNV